MSSFKIIRKTILFLILCQIHMEQVLVLVVVVVVVVVIQHEECLIPCARGVFTP